MEQGVSVHIVLVHKGILQIIGSNNFLTTFKKNTSAATASLNMTALQVFSREFLEIFKTTILQNIGEQLSLSASGFSFFCLLFL